MSEYTKTKDISKIKMKKVRNMGERSNYVGIYLIKQSNLNINQRKIWKKWKNRGRGQIMSEYTKTKIYLRWRWKKWKKKLGEGSNYDGIY